MYDREKDLIDSFVRGRLGRRKFLKRMGYLGIGTLAVALCAKGLDPSGEQDERHLLAQQRFRAGPGGELVEHNLHRQLHGPLRTAIKPMTRL